MMEDFAANADSLDGDFKALLLMRKNKAKQTEQQQKVMEVSIEKFMKKRKTRPGSAGVISNKKTEVNHQLKQDEQEKINLSEYIEQAFQAVDKQDCDSLKSIFTELSSKGGSIDQLIHAKNDESLLCRAVGQITPNTDVINLIISACSTDYIYIALKVTVGGKKTTRTVLHIASERGHIEAVKMIVTKVTEYEDAHHLLEKTTTIVPEGQRPRPMTCLHIAAKQGQDEIVRYLVNDCGMCVDFANSKGDTPLLWAANDNKPATVRLLLSLGADVNAQNDKKSSALHWACRNGYTKVVEALLESQYRTNVNIRRSLGLVCPLIAASAMGFLEIVELLIKHGADLEQKMGGGRTAIQLAAAEGHLNVVMSLISNGADQDALDDHGNTALLHAASHGHSNVVIFLGECGDDFSHRNDIGKSVWDFAMELSDSELLKALIEYVTTHKTQEQPSKRMSNKLPAGITPLHSAAAVGDLSVVELLLDMKLDPLHTDEDERIFLHVAAEKNQTEILKRCSSKVLCRFTDNHGFTPLHTACEFGHNDSIKTLLPCSDLGQVNHHGQTALHLAVRSKDVKDDIILSLVNQMIQDYDWTTLHSKDSQKRTALHLAVLSGNIDVITHLHHLSPDAKDIHGNTPMHLAVQIGDHSIMGKLIEVYGTLGKGIDVNAANSNGDTALHRAVTDSQDNMIEMLIKAGSDITALNGDGNSVLHELARCIASNRELSARYMKSFSTITGSVLYWWCKRIRQHIPNLQDEDSLLYTRDALMFLFTEVYNREGFNVLQYTAKLAVTEMVVSILNTPGVFQLTDMNFPNSVVYDVTDLLPRTSSWRGNSSQSAIAPAPVNKARSSEDSFSTMRMHDSVADILVKSEEVNQVAAILSVSPFKNIVASYWSSYQKVFAAAFLFHVLVMAVYSYCGITYLGCPTSVIVNTTDGQNTTITNQKPWGAEIGLAVGFIWPLLLILYDIAKLVLLMKSCVKAGCIQARQSYRGEADEVIGFLALQGSGLLYSLFAVVWYIMNRVCANYQDYILALSYIFGWIYAINFTRGFKHVHHFSIILRHIVFKDMLQFSFIYLFILLAFSFAYCALTQAIPSLKMGIGDIIFLVFNWMVGMSDFETDSDEFQVSQRSEGFVQLIYAMYIILSTIVLLNLLIAMMSDSYAEVRAKSEVMWTVGSLQLPLEFEKGLGQSRYNPHNLRFDIDKRRWYLTVNLDDRRLYDASATTTINELHGRINALNNNFDQLLKSFEQIKSKI